MNSDLPIYKAHKYEEGVKNWLVQHLSVFEKDMKIAMQISEREIMQSFAFKRKLRHGATIYSTLSETISIDGDHLIIKYQNELEGDGHEKVK